MSGVTVTLAARTVRAIGLMSGTSHDGISAAIVEINEQHSPPARLIAFANSRYAERLRARLLRAAAGDGVGTAEISALNSELGHAFGRAAMQIARRAGIPLERLSFIGSHGHTLFPSAAANRRARADPLDAPARRVRSDRRDDGCRWSRIFA